MGFPHRKACHFHYYIYKVSIGCHNIELPTKAYSQLKDYIWSFGIINHVLYILKQKVMQLQYILKIHLEGAKKTIFQQ